MKHILFIHGNSLSSESFRYQLIDTRLKANYHLHTLDLPGHGEGERLEKYSLSILIDAIVSKINSIETREIILVGHSLGGHLAIELLERNLNFNIEKLLIFGTPPLKNPIDMSAFNPDPMAGVGFQEILTNDQVRDWAVALGSSEFYEFIKTADPKVRSGIASDVGTGNVPDEVALLTDFNGEIAILHGENEKLVNLEYIKSLDLQIWRNEVIIVPDSGHSPQFENHDFFNGLLIDFVE